MLEKRLAAVPPQAFTANGGIDGIITVVDARLFKVKQEVILSATSLPNLDDVEVKRVVSPTQLAVGPRKGNIDVRTDVSAYTVALGAAIFANEQKRPSIPFEEVVRATYEEEPVVATRVIGVDTIGRAYDTSNPMPVSSVPSWDEIDLSYDANQNLETVVYKKGTLVETLSLEYDANQNLQKVTKS